MNQILEINQIEFVLTFEDESKTNLDLQVLKQKEVIPRHWKIAESLIHTEEISLLNFQNGIYILQRGDVLAFLETTNREKLPNLVVPEVMYQYLEKFPEESYQAFGVNVEGYIAFSNQDIAQNYLFETLFRFNSQHELDQRPAQAILNLIYKLDQGVLTLTAQNMEIAVPEQEGLSTIRFFGNFHHDISHFPEEERAHILRQLIMNWNTDVEIYREIVNSKFLNKQMVQVE